MRIFFFGTGRNFVCFLFFLVLWYPNIILDTSWYPAAHQAPITREVRAICRCKIFLCRLSLRFNRYPIGTTLFLWNRDIFLKWYDCNFTTRGSREMFCTILKSYCRDLFKNDHFTRRKVQEIPRKPWGNQEKLRFGIKILKYFMLTFSSLVLP